MTTMDDAFDAFKRNEGRVGKERVLGDPGNWVGDDEVVNPGERKEPADPSPSPEELALKNIDRERRAKEGKGVLDEDEE